MKPRENMKNFVTGGLILKLTNIAQFFFVTELNSNGYFFTVAFSI